jgi:hypothetical protein
MTTYSDLFIERLKEEEIDNSVATIDINEIDDLFEQADNEIMRIHNRMRELERELGHVRLILEHRGATYEELKMIPMALYKVLDKMEKEDE